MGTMFNTMELIFGASAKKVRVNDLLLMSKIGILGSDDPVTKDNLRKCFFPDFDDTKGGLLGVMQEWNENLGLIQQ